MEEVWREKSALCLCAWRHDRLFSVSKARQYLSHWLYGIYAFIYYKAEIIIGNCGSCV